MSNIKIYQNTKCVLAKILLRSTVLKIIFISTFPFFFLFLSLLFNNKVLAQNPPYCPLTITTDPPNLYNQNDQRVTAKASELNSITFNFDMSKAVSLGSRYDYDGYLYIYHDGPSLCASLYPIITNSQMAQGTTLYVTSENIDEILQKGISYKWERSLIDPFCNNYFIEPDTNKTITLTVMYHVGGQSYQICQPVQYTISFPFKECQIVPDGGGAPFNLNNDNKKIIIKDIIYDNFHYCIQTEITNPDGTKKTPLSTKISSDGESIEITMKRADYAVAGNYKVEVYQGTNLKYGQCENKNDRPLCTALVEIAPRDATPKPTQILPTSMPPLPSLAPICYQLKGDENDNTTDRGKCIECMIRNQDKTKPYVWTAFGCLPADLSGLIGDFIFKTGLGIAGGIAFLYFLYGSFLILTSSGNPEKIEEAKQIIVSALSGLILIIFSVFILEIIGVDILRLPGFEKDSRPTAISTPSPTSAHIPPGALFSPTPTLKPTLTPTPTRVVPLYTPTPTFPTATPNPTPVPEGTIRYQLHVIADENNPYDNIAIYACPNNVCNPNNENRRWLFTTNQQVKKTTDYSFDFSGLQNNQSYSLYALPYLNNNMLFSTSSKPTVTPPATVKFEINLINQRIQFE